MACQAGQVRLARRESPWANAFCRTVRIVPCKSSILVWPAHTHPNFQPPFTQVVQLLTKEQVSIKITWPQCTLSPFFVSLVHGRASTRTQRIPPAVTPAAVCLAQKHCTRLRHRSGQLHRPLSYLHVGWQNLQHTHQLRSCVPPLLLVSAAYVYLCRRANKNRP